MREGQDSQEYTSEVFQCSSLFPTWLRFLRAVSKHHSNYLQSGRTSSAYHMCKQKCVANSLSLEEAQLSDLFGSYCLESGIGYQLDSVFSFATGFEMYLSVLI